MKAALRCAIAIVLSIYPISTGHGMDQGTRREYEKFKSWIDPIDNAYISYAAAYITGNGTAAEDALNKASRYFATLYADHGDKAAGAVASLLATKYEMQDGYTGYPTQFFQAAATRGREMAASIIEEREKQRAQAKALTERRRLYHEALEYLKRGHPSAALANLIQARELDGGDAPDNPTRGQMELALAEAHAGNALGLHENGQVREAIEDLNAARNLFLSAEDSQRAKALEPRLAEWCALYGESVYQAGHWKDAEPYFEMAKQCSPQGAGMPIPELSRASTTPTDASRPDVVPRVGNFRIFMDNNGFTELRESNGEVRWWSRKGQSYLAADAVAEWKRRYENETRTGKP